MVLQDRYRILSKIGEGGMGAVYLAVHTLIERKLAIKILSQDFARKPDLVQRFLQEARAAARIGHENIVAVTDFGETTSGSVYIVMEYLEGCDLAQAIRAAAPGTMPLPRVRHIVLQICRALYAAHQKGIIHRDLKPENIFLVNRDGQEDFVKILDFGIAKISNIDETTGRLTRTGMIFGTPEYMSPEQARGDAPDHRVDIYALGCILYEMLTGSVPFAADTFMGVLTKQMFEPLEPPSRRIGAALPRELEETCLRALEKERDRRFQSMQTMAQALEGDPAALGGVVMAPISVGNSSRSYRMPAPPQGVLPGPSSFSGVPQSGSIPGPGQPEGLQSPSPSMVSQSGVPYVLPQALSGSYAGNYPVPVPLTIAPQVPAMGLGPPSRSGDETTQSALPLPGSPRTARVIAIVIGALFGVIVLLVVLLRQREHDKDGPHGTTGGSGAPSLVLPPPSGQGHGPAPAPTPTPTPASPGGASLNPPAPPPSAAGPQGAQSAPSQGPGAAKDPPPQAPPAPAKATPPEAAPRKQKPAGRSGSGTAPGPGAGPHEEAPKPTPRGLRDPFSKP
jgi:serine/threonine-protein kinase